MEDLSEIHTHFWQNDCLLINPRHGIILIKPYHAEFAGPGSVIGNDFDRDVIDILAVGNLSLLPPQNSEEKRKGYLIRRQWVLLMKQIVDNLIPRERAQVILNQFEHWFDATTATLLSDKIFGLLVGVLPTTIAEVRQENEIL